MLEKDKKEIIDNLLKIARQMSSIERQLLSFALEGLNESFNEWHRLSNEDKKITRESFMGIIALADQGKKLL